MRDNEDNDWGTGSFDRDEALTMARNYRDNLGYSGAYIAVIDDGPDPVCVDEIRDLEG
jgi:hypothetical protein